MGAWSEGGTTPEAEFLFALQTQPNNESCAYVFLFHYHSRSKLRYFQRSERSGGGDDSSPARLTMAQAALLNLRGQQVQGRLRSQQHLTTLSDQRRIQSAQAHPSLHDLSSMHHQHSRLPPHPVISQHQSEPKNLTASYPVSTHLQGRTDTQTPVGLSTAFGSGIDLSALSRAAGANGFTFLEQQVNLQLKYAYKRNSTHAGDPSIVLRAAAHCREVPLKRRLSSLAKARIFRGP